MKVFYDKDCDLSLIKGKTVAIIGYGSQGHAHAQNLNESGVKIVVGLRKGGASWPKVEKAGLNVMEVNDAVKAAESLGGKVWVVKAQIHAGGRGKGGGVKVAKSLDEVRQYASQILGMQLVTHQTGPAGQKVRRLLIEEGADIKKEYYVAALTDR